MVILSIDEMKDLMDRKAEPSVSMYSPMIRKGKETRQNPIRFKNLIGSAEKALREIGFRTIRITELLAPAYRLLENTPFWSHQSDGLAVFISPGDFRYYRLPVTFEETSIVSGRYHIKPLLTLFSGEQHFFVLAIGLKNIRVFRGSRQSIHQIEIPGLPESIDDILRYEDPEKHIQLHSGSGPGKGRRAAVFHGQGGLEKSRQKEYIARLYSEVDAALPGHIKYGSVPIILAGVEYLHGLYRDANSSPMLMDDGIDVNPDDLTEEKIHSRAWEVMQPILERRKSAGLDRYKELQAKGKASDKIEEIITSAYGGKVELLFFNRREHIWGKFDHNSQKPEIHEKADPGDEDLIDLAAVATIDSKGEAYALDEDEMPDGKPLAAIYRY
jgi:hypothetical protein